MVAEEVITKFNCDEYVNGNYSTGFYDKSQYLQVVLPFNMAEVINKLEEHLVVGHAGVDGIEFCFRLKNEGIWAYHPIQNVPQLVEKWCSGKIKL